jgi:hypothetical protein
MFYTYYTDEKIFYNFLHYIIAHLVVHAKCYISSGACLVYIYTNAFPLPKQQRMCIPPIDNIATHS